MDFLSLPEFFLSLIGVLAVFVTCTGLMILLAMQLTQDDDSFFYGIAVPAVLISYFRGWEAMGAWVLLTVLFMLARRGKATSWALGSAWILGMGVIWILILGELQGTGAIKYLLPLPALTIGAGVMLGLKWSWKPWATWFGVVLIPAAIMYVITLVGKDHLLFEIVRWAFLTVAFVLALATPMGLAKRRPQDCGQSIRIGISLMAGGAAAVLAMLAMHNTFFVR